MSACEPCWAEANRQALLSGGSVVDHYRALIATLGCPSHALPAPTQGETR